MPKKRVTLRDKKVRITFPDDMTPITAVQAGAIAIGTEAEATPDHVKRISFAKKILYGEMSTYQLAVAVTTNEAVKTAIVNDTESTDAEINAATSGLITPFVNAGAAT